MLSTIQRPTSEHCLLALTCSQFTWCTTFLLVAQRPMSKHCLLVAVSQVEPAAHNY